MTALPRAILFDLDDTIIRYPDRQRQLMEIAEEFQSALAPLAPSDFARMIEDRFKAFWADAAQYQHWNVLDARRRVFAEAFDALASEYGDFPPDLSHRLADRFHDRREPEMSFFPGAREAIDALKMRGVRLALITNGLRETQRIKIDRFDLARRFDHIQVEEEYGAGKPQEAVYRNAIQILGVTAQETWMVGDHLENDVAAPQRLGIHAIWHDHLGQGLPPDTTVRPDRVIHSLSELLPGEPRHSSTGGVRE